MSKKNFIKKIFIKLLNIPKKIISMGRAKLILVSLVGVLGILLIISWCRPANWKLFASKNIKEIKNEGENQDEVWTCSMHPQIRLPEPGSCPICYMDLIPLESGGDADGSKPELKLTKKAIELAKIKTVPIKYQNVERDILLNGMIDVDETTKGNISARFNGRIEKLYINFAGVNINKGDHVFKIYSPELFAAQDAYVKTYLSYKKSLDSDDSSYIKTEKKALKAAEARLLLLGITKNQINYLKKTLKPRETVPVFSEYSGIVISKKVSEGAYVKTGTVIYEIADLKKLWIILDAYETDIQWLHYGQEVSINVEAYPGQIFKGRISYIDPVLNEKTRTVKVRISINNNDMILKPGMLVTGNIKSRLTSNNKIVDNYLADKWISPMHPEIIKEKPGACDICGMPLVHARNFGYIKESGDDNKKLLIPASAPLITGKRAIVYVEIINDDGEFVYEGREVVLGPKTGAFYIVRSGLKEGDSVVVEGNFKLDAAMQILAKSSMMNRTYDKDHKEPDYKIDTVNLSDEQNVYIDKLLSKIVELNKNISIEDSKKSKESVDTLKELLETEKDNHFKKDELEYLLHAVYHLEPEETVEGMRIYLPYLNNFIQEFITKKSFQSKNKYFIFQCPEVNGSDESYWIDNTDNTNNPYFPSDDEFCGKLESTVGGA